MVSCCGHMEKKVLNIPKGKENHIPHCICFALRQDNSPTSPTATSIADTQGCPSPVLCPASFLHNTCPEGAGTSKGRSLIPTAFITSHHMALSQHGGQCCRFADAHFQSLVVGLLTARDTVFVFLTVHSREEPRGTARNRPQRNSNERHRDANRGHPQPLQCQSAKRLFAAFTTAAERVREAPRHQALGPGRSQQAAAYTLNHFGADF